MGSDPKTPTAPRVITGKLSFKKLPSLKLPAAFPEGKASTMSWVLWQPLITKTNDFTNGKSLSWISSGEFTRELDKEPLLN